MELALETEESQPAKPRHRVPPAAADQGQPALHLTHRSTALYWPVLVDRVPQQTQDPLQQLPGQQGHLHTCLLTALPALLLPS